jgi:hypothetical protein
MSLAKEILEYTKIVRRVNAHEPIHHTGLAKAVSKMDKNGEFEFQGMTGRLSDKSKRCHWCGSHTKLQVKNDPDDPKSNSWDHYCPHCDSSLGDYDW